ncbi:hypothetical protein [Methylocystis sp.]|uniref:hypothetical protein n=1 Tax=Methylocystis sp. TaxID=1911079 RepID=UPI003D14822D
MHELRDQKRPSKIEAEICSIPFWLEQEKDKETAEIEEKKKRQREREEAIKKQRMGNRKKGEEEQQRLKGGETNGSAT